MPLVRTTRAITAAAVLVVAAPVGMNPAWAAKDDESTAVTAVKSANHKGLGRLQLNTTSKVTYHVDQDGDHVVVRLDGNVQLGPAPAKPHNVVSIKTDGATLDLVLTHGARLRPTRVNGHIVLDIVESKPALAKALPSDPAPVTRPTLSMASSPELGGRSGPAPVVPATSPVSQGPAAAPPSPPVAAATPSGTAVAAPVEENTVESIQPTGPGRDLLPENEGPIVLRVRRTRLPKEMDGTAFLVPFGSSTAAAAFEEAGTTYIVFDERRPVDMAALAGDPVFGPTSVRLLANGTLLQVPHSSALSVVLTQLPQGWRIAAVTPPPKQQPIVAAYVDGHLNLAAEQPGDVISLADPVSGSTLLVGTQHRPGQGVTSSRQSTEFILRPTLQGVVIEPLADAISLKRTAAGFTLSGARSGLALSPVTGVTPALMDAAHLTRRLNLSTMPPAALLRLAVKQLGDASKAPPLARGPRRHAAAESFLALGFAAEAESLLKMAAEQDPKEAASADTAALTGTAAVLAGRVGEARGLLDPRLDGTDEIALWRAVLQATREEGSPAAAAVFAVTAPLALQYPAPMRDHVLPLILETMIDGGAVPAAARLLEQRKDDPKLAYARALLEQSKGDTAKTLEMLDAMAVGHDQYDRVRAAVRATELRLTANQISKVQAADALDKLLYAWRGDARELALRQRVAELRAQTGAWRTGLSMLRQAELDFPEQGAMIHGRLKDMFARMIHDQSADLIPPLDFVATVDENTDLLPDTADDQAVEQPLANRLLALDLPVRAKPVLEKLMHEAKSDVAKASFATSLATLYAREGDDAGVIAVLDASRTQGLSDDLAEQRLVLRANAMARQGDAAGAVKLLEPSGTPKVIEARAQILETAADWGGAEQAWASYATLTLPAEGTLDAAQARTVLRLAAATARAGDDSGLNALREKFASRIKAGPLADMIRLLTAEPVKTTADIKRSQAETNLAAALPAGLKALQAGIPAR